MTVYLRPASRDDAPVMAALADIASEGFFEKIWARQSDYNQSAQDYGTAQAGRDKGLFSWRNAVMAERNGEVAGMILPRSVGAAAREMQSDMHPILRPLVRLENEALDTRDVSILATFPAHRRHGVATALLESAEATPGNAGMSVLIADGNTAGRHFATHHGYREADSLPLVRSDWDTDNAAWILMRKP